LGYHPDTNKVQKHRLVKFVSNAAVEKQTQTGEADLSDDYNSVSPRTSETTVVVQKMLQSQVYEVEVLVIVQGQ